MQTEKSQNASYVCPYILEKIKADINNIRYLSIRPRPQRGNMGYLDPLDHMMAERGFEMVRYADDFVVMCRSEEEAAAALAVVPQWTVEAGLTLHPTKTRLVNEREDGFDFLGYHFEAGKRWPRT